MKRASASDLSLDLLLTVLEERSPIQTLLSGLTCSQCKSQTIIYIFQCALRFVEQHTSPCSWQRHRLHALLGPLYLESLQCLPEVERYSPSFRQKDATPPRTAELLLASTLWGDPSWCAHQKAINGRAERLIRTIEELSMICHEVLRSVDEHTED